MKRFIRSKPVLMAAALTFAVAAWMLTGLVGRSTPAADVATLANARSALTRVSIRESRATTVTREIVVSARTEPNRAVQLRAETDGRVVALGAERGSSVSAGERIVGLDMRDRESRLEETRAVLAHMELQLEAARRLKGQQFISEVQIAEAGARVAAARTALRAIELEIEHTNLAAPFDAVLQDRTVELGDYVSSGDTIGELADIDPLVVVGDVSEREVPWLGVGTRGFARLVTGETVEGRIRYLAPIAERSTRTFRVELAVPNRDGILRAGMTAELRLAVEDVAAHVLSPSLLTLDDAGVIGVKAVDTAGRVQFYPIEILDSSADGISVTGLPDAVRVISVGQGFVTVGEQVEAVPADSFEAPVTDRSTQTPAAADRAAREAAVDRDEARNERPY